MFGVYKLLVLTLCFVSQSRARLSVTVMDRDYGSVQHSDVLVTHIRRVLDSMGALRVTLHPRVRVLYELLRRDARLRVDHARQPTPASLSRDQLFALDFHRTLTPVYDVNKLNRIFTTTERNF
nr:uncharacterized protein LOC110382641 isoform X1 [Helicoverpa armigera]